MGQLPLHPVLERLVLARRAGPEPLRPRPLQVRLELGVRGGRRRQPVRGGAGHRDHGSVVCPSAACSIVGVKPTVGLTSRAGVIPISRTQDTVGAMARTVADAAVVLGAIAGGPDPRDLVTKDSRVEADYTRFLDPNSLRGARIGVARDT